MYVYGAEEPTLTGDRLAEEKKDGRIALFGNSADGLFANLTVTPA